MMVEERSLFYKKGENFFTFKASVKASGFGSVLCCMAESGTQKTVTRSRRVQVCVGARES